LVFEESCKNVLEDGGIQDRKNMRRGAISRAEDVDES